VLEVTARTAEGEIMGVRHKSLRSRGAVSSGERAHARWPDLDEQFSQDLGWPDAYSRQTLEHLLERRDLTETQAADLLGELTKPILPPAMAGALLTALRCKGETSPPKCAVLRAMRALARKPALPNAPDGHRISWAREATLRQLESIHRRRIAHGRMRLVRRETRQSLHIEPQRQRGFDRDARFTLPLDEIQAAPVFRRDGFTFLFAPYFIRDEISRNRSRRTGHSHGVQSIGALTNPAAPRFQLIGAYDAATAELMAELWRA